MAVKSRATSGHHKPESFEVFDDIVMPEVRQNKYPWEQLKKKGTCFFVPDDNGGRNLATLARKTGIRLGKTFATRRGTGAKGKYKGQKGTYVFLVALTPPEPPTKTGARTRTTKPPAAPRKTPKTKTRKRTARSAQSNGLNSSQTEPEPERESAAAV